MRIQPSFLLPGRGAVSGLSRLLNAHRTLSLDAFFPWPGTFRLEEIAKTPRGAAKTSPLPSSSTQSISNRVAKKKKKEKKDKLNDTKKKKSEKSI